MKCPGCWEDKELINVKHSGNFDMSYCKECLNNKLAKAELAYFRWEYYDRNHPDIRLCSSCSTPIHKEFALHSDWYCMRCTMRYRSWLRYCPTCWVYHRDWICNASLADDTPSVDGRLNFVVRNDSKSWNPRGEAVDNTSYIKSIWQFQTERETPTKIKELLTEFYHHNKTFNHYYTREPIKIEGTVRYNNVQILSNIQKLLDRVRRWPSIENTILRWEKISRFHNYYLQWMDENWLVKWKYIDTMWNIRERSESINKFYDDCKVEKTNEQMTWEFRYVLSSDLKHKVAAFNLNERVHSCQKSGNSDSYARWAYDAITNWCNCPILLYTKNGTEPFARITTRIMYDKEGQEYILIDRLYHSWQFSDAAMRGEIYKSIVTDLKAQWYKVIASNYSAHDDSTYSYLASLWMKSDTVITDLCQPLRRLISNCGYYCDGWTVVRKWEIDWLVRATDYLDKAYLL